MAKPTERPKQDASRNARTRSKRKCNPLLDEHDAMGLQYQPFPRIVPVLRALGGAGFDGRLVDLVLRSDRFDVSAAVHEFRQRLVRGGLPHDASRKRVIVVEDPSLVHDLFAPLEEQVANIARWNAKHRWGFLQSDLTNIPNPPAWPEDRLVAVVLVPYLDDHQGIGGIQRTFDELWDVGSRRQKKRDRWSEVRSDPQHLSLLPGITHTPMLRWEVIDLGANWDKEHGIAPKYVRSPTASPHAGILAAVAHHRRWVRTMDGTAVPFVWLSGYMLAVPGHAPRVPIVYWYRDERLVLLFAGWDGNRGPDYAVPAFQLPAPRESGR